jgi:hypothetical protein
MYSVLVFVLYYSIKQIQLAFFLNFSLLSWKLGSLFFILFFFFLSISLSLSFNTEAVNYRVKGGLLHHNDTQVIVCMCVYEEEREREKKKKKFRISTLLFSLVLLACQPRLHACTLYLISPVRRLTLKVHRSFVYTYIYLSLLLYIFNIYIL